MGLKCKVDLTTRLRYLKLTGCAEGDFTCDDGQCVTMEQRCNQLPDCRDRSDETNCQILFLENKYNRNIPPITVDNGIKKKVNVSVSIHLSKVVDIDEEDYSIEMQFSIILKWMENRATYQNLKEDQSLNALTQEDIQQLWLPKVIYKNTDQKESTRLGTQCIAMGMGNKRFGGKEYKRNISWIGGSRRDRTLPWMRKQPHYVSDLHS